MKGIEQPDALRQETPQTEEERRAEAILRYIDARVIGANETLDQRELAEIAAFYAKLSPREKADTLYAKLMAYTLDQQAEAA